MLKERVAMFVRIMMFMDACIVLCGYYLCYFLCPHTVSVELFEAHNSVAPAFVFIWVILLNVFGMYESFRVKRIRHVFWIILKVMVFGFLFFVSFMYIFDTPVNKTTVMLSFLFTGWLIFVEKFILTIFLRYIRMRGLNYRNILIFGTGKRAQDFVSLIEKHNEWGLKIIGMIDEDVSKKHQVVKGYQVLGAFNDVESIVHNNVVDEVVFVVPRSWLTRIEPVMKFLETEGIKIHLAVDYFELELSRAKQTDLNGFPLITFESTPAQHWQLLAKRIMDVFISAASLIVLFPVFIAIAFIIKLTSAGPVFFKQTRSGLSGRKFTMYKFRTMIKDAESKLEELRKHNEMKGPAFKMEDDPRLTDVGKVLRKTSLDELPQLWNVLKGDMSLVGPRPPLPAEVEKYDYWQRRRLSMKPGLTCLWQIGGRSKITDFDEWMKLDLKYIDKWSLWLDFQILFQTIPVVLFGHGAK